MKVRKTAGLVGAGCVSRSFLARMPTLLEHLGPVKGTSFHVSRRLANSLRAGTGVAEYAALQPCELIWIFAPENLLDQLTGELAAKIRLEGKMVVLCDALRDSLWPNPLRTAGARVATLNCVPESRERTFIAEGHPAVIADLDRLLRRDGRKLIELRPATKSLYLSGIHLSSHLLLPWIAGAVRSLRAAGFSRAEATRAVQALGTHALRAYSKAGDKAWNRVSAEHLHHAIERDLDVLRLTDSRLAALYSEGAERMLRFFAKPAQKERRANVVAIRSS
jgi:predicted short-subunit dehydrogenase-like oxidoreductase (DUF2520 family)